MPEPTYKIAQRLLASRAAVGVKQYGDDLTANSPGCMIVHALQEAADQVNYLIAEIQRRWDAIRILLDTAERLTQWNDVNLNEDARQLVRVIDLLGGEAALVHYDEILGGGTVAENATVAALPKDADAEAALATVWRKEAEAEICRMYGVEPRKIVAEAIADLSAEQASTDPRDEALRVAAEALCDARDQIEALCSADDVPDSVHSALAAIRGAL